MAGRGSGSLIFTGATARCRDCTFFILHQCFSLRGAAGHSAFSAGMMAKRAVAQSLARELGPAGVHVAHVVVDAAVDNPNTHKVSHLCEIGCKTKDLLALVINLHNIVKSSTKPVEMVLCSSSPGRIQQLQRSLKLWAGWGVWWTRHRSVI